MQIVPGDFSDRQIMDLLHFHVTSARAQTAVCSAHALDHSALQSPDIKFWAAWEGEVLLGIGALKLLTENQGEIKSMHTAESARGKGVGTAMLSHIIAAAKDIGLSRLSLETGSSDYFRPAHKLYLKHGFIECPPFSDYVPDPNSVFMSLDLPQLSSKSLN